MGGVCAMAALITGGTAPCIAWAGAVYPRRRGKAGVWQGPRCCCCACSCREGGLSAAVHGSVGVPLHCLLFPAVYLPVPRLCRR